MSTLQIINAKHPSSSINNIVLDSAGNAAIGGTLSMASSFKRNRIINGNMGVWQRGTSGFATNNSYCADRWIAKADTSFTSAARSTDVPTGYQYSLTVTGTGYAGITQRIEAVNCYGLVGQSVTVSFWAKQTTGAGASSLAIAIYYPTAGVDTYTGGLTQIGSTINATGTTSWAQYSVTFAGLPSGVLNGIALHILSNVAGASTILLTGVQLEIGTVATPYEMQIYCDQLTQCQRYYFRQSGSPANNGYARFAYAQIGGSSTYALAMLIFPTTMRAPASSIEFANLACYDAQVVASATAVIDTATLNNCNLQITTSGMTVYRPATITANNTNTLAAYLGINAEL